MAPPVFDLAPRPVEPAGRAGRGRVATAAADWWLLVLLLLVLATPAAPPMGLLTRPVVPMSISKLSQPSPSSAASQPPPPTAVAAGAALAELALLLLTRGAAAAGLLLLLPLPARLLPAGGCGLDDMLRRLRRFLACNSHTPQLLNRHALQSQPKRGERRAWVKDVQVVFLCWCYAPKHAVTLSAPCVLAFCQIAVSDRTGLRRNLHMAWLCT